MESSNDDTLWKEIAKSQQIEYARYFHTSSWDTCSISTLKSRISVCIFGVPDKLPDDEILSYEHYTKTQQETAKEIAECILNNQKRKDEDKIYISFVLVLGRSKCKNHIQFQECIYKVPGKDGIRFIDKTCRVYKNWSCYLEENTIPKATICTPVNGEYKRMDESFSVEFRDTPACRVKRDVLNGFDIATTVTGIVCSIVGTATLFVPIAGPIAAPLIWSAYAVSAASGAYGFGRSIEYLVDRGQHEQTLSLKNTQARSAWLGATVQIFGIAAGGATAITAASKVSKLGIAISQSARTAINVTNGINCFAHGVLVVHDVCSIIESKIKDGTVTQFQIFQCIASALFFANAVICAHQARILLQSIPVHDNASSSENIILKLSKSMYKENGINIRPTNFVANANITPMMSMLCSWGGLVFNIPQPIAVAVEDIFKFLLKNQKAEFATIAFGLMKHLKKLWEVISEQTPAHSYLTTRKCNGNLSSSDSANKLQRFKNCQSSASTSTDKSSNGNHFKDNNMCANVNDSKMSFQTAIGSQKDKSQREDELEDENDYEVSGQITITDLKWEGQKELLENALQGLLHEQNITMFEVLQISHIFFERVKKDVAEREELFQNALQQAQNLKEEEMEKIFGITGNRSQFFANEIMKSYRDVKLIAMKQDCQKILEKEGVQVPLYSFPDSPIHLFYYKSSQRKGTKTERFFNVLQRAGVIPTSASYTYFPSENSIFLQFNDQDSKYAMAGIIDFAEDSNMMGIIVLQHQNSKHI